MSEWWQKAYPGGPAVTTTPLPRPLYFPGNPAGKPPSEPGDDVLAAKRILSRGGRWPWTPSEWDSAFSRNFALGSGPNVIDSGVAGYQRQMGIEDSGQVGTATFNSWRNARIPEGLPNAGQPLMDATAIKLMEQAWAKYGGKEPDAKSARQKALDHQQARLGYTEDPPGSNCDNRSDGIRTAQDHTADGTWLRGQPWCGCWCYYALEAAGVAKLDPSLASVAQIEDNARAGAKCFKGWTTDPSKPQIGDLVVIGGYGVHVEMVRAKPTSETTDTYGGNTSQGTSGSQANGGGAFARTRYRGEIRGYALVRYPDD